MREKLEQLEQRFLELEGLLADPATMNDKAGYQQLAKELSDISPLVYSFRELKNSEHQRAELQKELEKSGDAEFRQLAHSEIEDLAKKEKEIEARIEGFFKAQQGEDKFSNRDVIIEIRAGTGGEEAALFAGDLYRMYTKYALAKNWKVELMDSNPTDLHGFKEVIFAVRGKEVYKRLRHESGVHRVQRVPQTEASGRIHTSAATVAVMMEPEEVELEIEPKDLRIDVFRSSGRGGQHVNTTDSAVRLTHLPSGLVVTCQDERSQIKNRIKAMRVLRARLLDKMQADRTQEQSQLRKSQVGTGDRSEKIRTYNFPDRRVTDHRIGFTSHNLEAILEGDLDEMTDALIAAEQKEE